MILGINGIIAGKGVVTSSLNTNLVSAYSFTNNLNDSFGTNNGTGYGGVSFGTTSGLIYPSVGFNAANAWVELPNGSGQFNFSGDFSFSVWLKWGDLSNYPGIISNVNQSGSDVYGYFFFYHTATNTLRFVIANGTSVGGTLIMDHTPTLNTWYHYVITRKQSTINKLYINGSLMTPTSTSNPSYNPNYLPTTTTYLGARYATNLYNGWMDELDFWNKELTSTEVTELYNSGVGKQYPF